MRHFLSLSDFDRKELWSVLERAKELKGIRHSTNKRLDILENRIFAMLFEKPSTRTRLSFEVAIKELGGDVIFMGANEVGLGKREAVKDVARTISRYVHGVVLRTFEHDKLLEFAEYSKVPVINALTDFLHPCQALSDVFTIWERFPVIEDVKVCFIGDGNNVAHSLIFASAIFGFELQVLVPKSHMPSPVVLSQAAEISERTNGRVSFKVIYDVSDIGKVDVVYTDVWVSMGQETVGNEKKRDFAGFQLNKNLIERLGQPFVMHCLPAHRGEEIEDDVIDGDSSIVFEQAENRLHVQKAVVEWLWIS